MLQLPTRLRVKAFKRFVQNIISKPKCNALSDDAEYTPVLMCTAREKILHFGTLR
jgi:hypothetical protein